MTIIHWEELEETARRAKENAYAPYSHFPVGAAILAGGRIFAGCNVENASYPVGICAERSAVAQAISAGCRNIEAVVIVANKPITPCGMCRQTLSEFNPAVPIRMLVGQQLIAETTLAHLLPSAFVLNE